MTSVDMDLFAPLVRAGDVYDRDMWFQAVEVVESALSDVDFWTLGAVFESMDNDCE